MYREPISWTPEQIAVFEEAEARLAPNGEVGRDIVATLGELDERFGGTLRTDYVPNDDEGVAWYRVNAAGASPDGRLSAEFVMDTHEGAINELVVLTDEHLAALGLTMQGIYTRFFLRSSHMYAVLGDGTRLYQVKYYIKPLFMSPFWNPKGVSIRRPRR